jgi:hypothetical protein
MMALSAGIDRYNMSPEDFNKRVCSEVLATKKLDEEPEWGGLVRNLSMNGDPFIRVVSSSDARIRRNIRCLSLDAITLPVAVREKLGYQDVRTVADWMRQLPVAKRINWKYSEQCMVDHKASATLTPLKPQEKTVTAGFHVEGREDDCSIYLCYSLDGSNIGEAVISYNYDHTHYMVVPGRLEEQNDYDHKEYAQHLATLEPLQEVWDDARVAKATFVTISIPLRQDRELRSPHHRISNSGQRSRHIPETVATDRDKGMLGYDGNFLMGREGFISVVTAVGAECSTKSDAELHEYYKTLSKRVDLALDAASYTLFGPTVERVTEIMLNKSGLLYHPTLMVSLLEKAKIVRLDFTGKVVPHLDSEGEVAVYWSQLWPTKCPKQQGEWTENFPQVIQYYTDNDVLLPHEQRMLRIWNYDPKVGGYMEYVMTLTPRPAVK